MSQACAQDSTLKRDVESLLSQNESAGELLEDPLYGSTVMNQLELLATDDDDPMIGRRLGAYRSCVKLAVVEWERSMNPSGPTMNLKSE